MLLLLLVHFRSFHDFKTGCIFRVGLLMQSQTYNCFLGPHYTWSTLLYVKFVWSTDEADSSTINALTYLKSHQVISVNSTGQMKIWDLRQPASQPTRVFLLAGEKTALHCIDRHPTQAHLVAAGGQDGVLNFWDLRQEKFPVTLIASHKGPSKSLLCFLLWKKWSLKFCT